MSTPGFGVRGEALRLPWFGCSEWAGQDSNLRSFRSDFTDRSLWPLGNLPVCCACPVGTRPTPIRRGQSRRRESNPQPTVYKTVALPLSYAG